MEEQTGTDDSGASSADPRQPRRSWFWLGRRLFGLTAPIVVIALAVMIYLMFDTIPDDDDSATIDTVIVYGLALLCPMGLTAFAGYACATATRGYPVPLLGRISSAVNLLLTVILIVPALCTFPFFLLAAPFMIPELIAWMRAG